MELENTFRYLVGGYYGVALMDEYPLKEYMLKDIENYIRDFVEQNPIPNFSYKEEAMKVKDKTSEKESKLSLKDKLKRKTEVEDDEVMSKIQEELEKINNMEEMEENIPKSEKSSKK